MANVSGDGRIGRIEIIDEITERGFWEYPHCAEKMDPRGRYPNSADQ